jgi:hypothetical protein
VAAALMLFTGSASRSRPAVPPSKQLVALTGKLVDGMSKQQVLQAVGKPATTRGRCWQYPVAPSPRAPRGVVSTVVGVCFFGGRVSDLSTRDYVRRRGKFVPLPRPKITFP